MRVDLEYPYFISDFCIYVGAGRNLGNTSNHFHSVDVSRGSVLVLFLLTCFTRAMLRLIFHEVNDVSANYSQLFLIFLQLRFHMVLLLDSTPILGSCSCAAVKADSRTRNETIADEPASQSLLVNSLYWPCYFLSGCFMSGEHPRVVCHLAMVTIRDVQQLPGNMDRTAIPPSVFLDQRNLKPWDKELYPAHYLHIQSHA